MALEFTEQFKREVILAAFNAAGPGASDGVVQAQQARILDAFEDGSPMMNVFERAKERAEKVVSSSGVVGEVIYVDTETTSQRPVVFLRTGTDRTTDGIEHFRLDRLDSNDSERVRALANELVSLVGHKVFVQKVVESGKTGNTRVLRGVQDRGPGGADISGLTNDRGWQLIDWQGNQDRQKMAGKLKRLATYQQRAAQQPVGA